MQIVPRFRATTLLGLSLPPRLPVLLPAGSEWLLREFALVFRVARFRVRIPAIRLFQCFPRAKSRSFVLAGLGGFRR